MTKHKYYVCDGSKHYGFWHCNFCDFGLKMCNVCGGTERSLPTECPGERMTASTEEQVYAGEIDFKDGKWVKKTRWEMQK